MQSKNSKSINGTDVLNGNAVRLVVGVAAFLLLRVIGPPSLFERLQASLVEQAQNGVVEQVPQRRTFLNGHGVRLAREFLAHHLQVAIDQHLVTDVCCVTYFNQMK